LRGEELSDIIVVADVVVAVIAIISKGANKIPGSEYHPYHRYQLVTPQI
jgi:hypothetical protein